MIKDNNRILLVSGTCASGKTTIGQIISDRHGFKHIEGDVVLKNKINIAKANGSDVKIGWNEIHSDIIAESLDLIKQSSVVITHAILPSVIPQYENLYFQHKIPFDIIILMPTKNEAISRSKQRTCWNHPTPENVIISIHDDFMKAETVYGKYFIDNTNLSPEKLIGNYMLQNNEIYEQA